MRTCCVDMGRIVSATYATPYCLRWTASVYSVHSRPRNTTKAIPTVKKPSLHGHSELTYTMICCLKVAPPFLRRVRLELRATDNTCLLGPRRPRSTPCHTNAQDNPKRSPNNFDGPLNLFQKAPIWRSPWITKPWIRNLGPGSPGNLNCRSAMGIAAALIGYGTLH